MPLEVLDCALVLERLLARGKRAEISAPASFRIFLARVEAVLARGKLADHGGSSSKVHYAPELAATASVLNPIICDGDCRMGFVCITGMFAAIGLLILRQIKPARNGHRAAYVEYPTFL
jgi:hypothetical protein